MRENLVAPNTPTVLMRPQRSNTRTRSWGQDRTLEKLEWKARESMAIDMDEVKVGFYRVS